MGFGLTSLVKRNLEIGGLVAQPFLFDGGDLLMTVSIAQGDAVTNARCPDWGTGVVLSIGTSSADVQFPEIGRKRLLLEVLLRSSAPAPTFPKRGKKADAPAASAGKANPASPAKAAKPVKAAAGKPRRRPAPLPE